MTANATHPGRITIPGTDIGVRGTLVAEPQTENELLTLSDRLALGPVKVDTDHDGVLQGTGLVVPIVTGVLWLLRFEPHNNDVPAFTLGVYNLNTSGVDLKDLVETVPTAIDATAMTHILDIESQLATFTTANDGVVSPLIAPTSGSATRTALNAALPARKLDDFIPTPGANNSTQINAAFTAARAGGFMLRATAGTTYRGHGIDPTGTVCDWTGATLKVPDGVTADHIFKPTGGFTTYGGTFDGNMAGSTDPGGATTNASGLSMSVGTGWAVSTAYTLGQQRSTPGGYYVVTTAGTSAATGLGPSGTGTGITDGTVVWSYLNAGGWVGTAAMRSGPVIQNCWGCGVSATSNSSIIDASLPMPTSKLVLENAEVHHNRYSGLNLVALNEPEYSGTNAHHNGLHGVFTSKVFRPIATSVRSNNNGTITTPESVPGLRDAVGTGHGYSSIHCYGDVIGAIVSNDNVKGGIVFGGSDPSGTWVHGRGYQVGSMEARRNGVLSAYMGVTFDPTITGFSTTPQPVDAKVGQIISVGNGGGGVQLTNPKNLDIAQITADSNGSGTATAHGIAVTSTGVSILVARARSNGGHGIVEFGTTTGYGGNTYGVIDSSGNATSNGIVFMGAGTRSPSTWLQRKKVDPVTSTATYTIDWTQFSSAKITAQAAALNIANPTGTAMPMQSFILRIKDNGTARAITYGTQIRAIGVTLPTTTVVSKTLYLGFIWNSDDTKLDCISVGQE